MSPKILTLLLFRVLKSASFSSKAFKNWGKFCGGVDKLLQKYDYYFVVGILRQTMNLHTPIHIVRSYL